MQFLGLCYRTSQNVIEMLGNINTSSALAVFEEMEEKGTVSPFTFSLGREYLSYEVGNVGNCASSCYWCVLK